MLLRLRTASGTQRIEISENATLAELVSKIQDTLKIQTFHLTKDASGTDPLNPAHISATLASLQLKHGDMLYVKPTGKEEAEEAAPVAVPVVEEEAPIDKELSSRDGWIQRERDERLCKHGRNAKCGWCMPIAPWNILEHDPWKKERVRWIPFHAYLRKRQDSTGCKHPESQKCLNCKSLEIPTFKVKPCNKHPPWPEGICTECEPGACRLDLQVYRHVDHMEVESAESVDRFIQAWRDTRNQRCGYLYGRYVPDSFIPLGIRAVVCAIYEPPQKNSQTEVVLEKDPDEEVVEALASSLGLERVGFIWTDLKINSSGKIISSRNFGDSPLSSGEILRMAKMQNKYPNVCRQAFGGKMGSKFISALVTGNDEGTVELQVFQASDQCMQLVKDGIVTASKDPQFMRVKRLKNRYIPDIMYKSKDEYNNEVVRRAEPNMPLEFFIIRIAESSGKKSNPLFKQVKFPFENRNSPQSLEIVQQQIGRSSSLHEALADFHLLVFLARQFGMQVAQPISEYILTKKNEQQVKGILAELLKNVKAPSSAPVTQAKSHPQEREWITALMSMGFTATQAQEALWATSYQGIEAAIDFLSR